MGAAGVGATIYFGSDESRRQIVEVARGLRGGPRARHGHRALVLPAQHRVQEGQATTTLAADLTGQANHLGVTIQADIIKQKLPENNGGYKALNQNGDAYGKTDKRVYERADDRPPDRPDAATRSPTATWAAPALINSGGASRRERPRRGGETAVINKRAGGMGLISGRKAFQRPMAEGVALLNAIQDVYLCQRSRSPRWRRPERLMATRLVRASPSSRTRSTSTPRRTASEAEETARADAARARTRGALEKQHKHGTLRFVMLVLLLIATAVLVTVAMFQTLYIVMG